MKSLVPFTRTQAARRPARLLRRAGTALALAGASVALVGHAETGWLHLADEGQAFNVGESPKTVRFGAGGRWVQTTMTGSAICWSEFFGSDPQPKLKKTCEVKTGAAATPAAASVPASASASASAAHGSGSAHLSWSAPTRRANGAPLAQLAGYRVLYGTASGTYTHALSVKETSVTIDGLAPGTYFFVVKAVDAAGRESSVSPEVSKTIR